MFRFSKLIQMFSKLNRSDCQAKHEEFQEMVNMRMKQYDEMPLVVKLREHEAELDELRQVVESRKQENEMLRQSIEERQARRGGLFYHKKCFGLLILIYVAPICVFKDGE